MNLNGSTVVPSSFMVRVGVPTTSVRRLPRHWASPFVRIRPTGTRTSAPRAPIRNRRMLAEEHRVDEPIDLCLAFHNDITRSTGTKDMVTLARKAGLQVRLVTSPNVQGNDA